MAPRPMKPMDGEFLLLAVIDPNYKHKGLSPIKILLYVWRKVYYTVSFLRCKSLNLLDFTAAKISSKA